MVPFLFVQDISESYPARRYPLQPEKFFSVMALAGLGIRPGMPDQLQSLMRIVPECIRTGA